MLHIAFFGHLLDMWSIEKVTEHLRLLEQNQPNHFCSLLRFTKDTARFKDELDIMKFICKDFWTTVFKKQIDNLRTNHQVLILQHKS